MALQFLNSINDTSKFEVIILGHIPMEYAEFSDDPDVFIFKFGPLLGSIAQILKNMNLKNETSTTIFLYLEYISEYLHIFPLYFYQL